MCFLNGNNYLRNMKKIKPNEGNKTFCMAPWTHTYLSPQTERRMCCASREPAQSFKQYIDTDNNAKKYKPMTLKEHWKTCDRNSYKPYSLNVIKEMQDKYEKYKK